MTYPDYRVFAPIAYSEFALIMLLVGATSGALISIILKLRVRGAGVAQDALRGRLGPWLSRAFYGSLAFGITPSSTSALHSQSPLPFPYFTKSIDSRAVARKHREARAFCLAAVLLVN